MRNCKTLEVRFHALLTDPVNLVDPFGQTHLGKNHIDLSINTKNVGEYLRRLGEYAIQEAKHGGNHTQKLVDTLRSAKNHLSEAEYCAARTVQLGTSSINTGGYHPVGREHPLYPLLSA
jgi:ribosomal protein S19